MTASINIPRAVSLAATFILSLIAAVYFEKYYLVLLPFLLLLGYLGWNYPQYVFYLLLLSLPFSFEYNFSPELGTDIPDEALMLLTGLLFIAVFIYDRSQKTKDKFRHPLIFLLVIHFAWIITSSLLSSDQLVSIKYSLSKSWYLAAFVLAPLILFRDKRSILLAAKLLVGAMITVVVVIMIRHGQQGFHFRTVNEAVSPFFRNHVNYSSMLVCLLPVIFGLYIACRNRRTRFFLLTAILVLLAALFFSYARGAWLALVSGAVAMGLIYKKRIITAFFACILLLLALVQWLRSVDRYMQFAHQYKSTIFHENFQEHLVATYQLKDVSTAERFYRWIAGVRMSGEKPLTGFGPNTFNQHYKPYAVPAFKTWVSDNRDRSTVHNYFLLVLIEQGIPGLLFFLLLLGAMLYYAQNLYHRAKDVNYKIMAMVIGVIIVMVATVNFLSDLLETDKVGSVFFLCLAVLVAMDYQLKHSEPPTHIERIA